MTTFFQRLTSEVTTKGSLLCVGLDPRMSSTPEDIRSRRATDAQDDPIFGAILSQNRRIIEETSEFAAAFKPNIAYYEAWGSVGLRALEETIRLIPAGVPIVLDAKRSDIGATSEAYAKSAFSHFGVDAVTVNPYLGKDSIEPFLAYRDRGAFVLCRTSNPGAGKFQDVCDSEQRLPLFMRVASEVESWSSQLGLVVAGNDLNALHLVRRAHPQIWFLAPGIGVQGGTARDAVSAGLRSDGMGILVVAGRAIAEAERPGEAAKLLRDEINRARGRVSGSPVAAASKPAPTEGPKAAPGSAGGHNPAAGARTAQESRARKSGRRKSDRGPAGHHAPVNTWREPGLSLLAGESLVGYRKRMVLHGLVRTGCFRTGSFTLKSGMISPFYVDLRRTISDPVFLKLVAQAYAEISRDLDFSRIAGVPMAALPIAAAVSLETGVPMIYPRLPVKPHGTGNRIEGEFQKGERVLLLDDLITTGQSKVEAASVLRDEGLSVTDLVVLLERSPAGRQDLAAEGIKVHAYARVEELFATCREMDVIDDEQERRMRQFVEEGN